LLAACVATVTAVVGVVAVPANAAPARAGATPVGAAASYWDPATGASATTEADAQRIAEAYWTKERMASAKPAPLGQVDTAKGTPDTRTDSKAPQILTHPALPAAGVQSGPGVQDAAFSYANGKVFFLDPIDGLNYVCSGSPANSGKRRLILTAGHCVHGGPGRTWMQNWYFVPGYSQGWEPNGRFTAWAMWTWTGWMNNEDRHWDYAFVIANNNSANRKVVEVAGGHGLVSNAGRPFVHVAGYPGNKDGGEIQWYCWGTTWRLAPWRSDQTLNCDFGGGASGGPWLRDYDHNNGLGYAISVTSQIGTFGINTGPYFDHALWTLFNTAENNSPA